MSQGEQDKMPTRIDFSGGVRGALLARYQRWAGITTASGPLPLNIVTTGESVSALRKIVLDTSHLAWPSRTAQVPRTITPEVPASQLENEGEDLPS